MRNGNPDFKVGLLAPCGTALAIIACYGTLVVVGALSLVGFTIAIHEGVWAGAIVIFALLALFGILLGWKKHRQTIPLLFGMVAVGLIVWTMGFTYSRLTEVAGFFLLVLAAALDWRARRKCL